MGRRKKTAKTSESEKLVIWTVIYVTMMVVLSLVVFIGNLYTYNPQHLSLFVFSTYFIGYALYRAVAE